LDKNPEMEKETFTKEAPKIEEHLAKRLVTKEDFFSSKRSFTNLKLRSKKGFPQ